MLRAIVLALLAVTASAACRKDTDPPPMTPKEGDLPPLPPSSGTPVGYLLDNASQLQLREDQLQQLRTIDISLSARSDQIDTQLRLIEKPEPEAEVPKGAPPPRYDHAPGASVRTTPDAAKLHAARKENDNEALQKAFAVLDPAQRTTARKLLEDRGIAPPGSTTKPPPRSSDDGEPLR